MQSKIKYWDILCEKQTVTFFRRKINVAHLSERKLIDFIHILLSKYALSDDEIFEQFITIPFKKKINHINIIRTNSNLGEPLQINFMSQVADISVTVSLVE